MVELKLLGSPQILLHGRPLGGLSAAKSQALLFYLAVNGRPQSRLALAGLLWPDKRETDALANLRQSLYHLRNALPDYLEINRLTVAFNATLPCQIDAILFEKEVAESNDLVTRQTAIDRYNGEFLAGFYVDEAEPFEAWAVVIRERLHRLATEALHDLVADFGARQEITLGLRYVNQWLALEPWQEAAHRHKIQFLAWDGQTQAALAHYERCRQLLAEELGAAPSAETVALVEQIQRGESAGKTRRPEDQKTENQKTEDQKAEAPALAIQNPKSKIENQHDWGEMPDVRTLWGRDAEIQQVEQWLVTERQRVVIILGMGGMGKTTLAATLAPRLAPHFAWVLWRSLLNAPPLSDILRDWVQTLSGYTLTTWPTLFDAQLTLLFTQLRQQRCLLVLDNVESILSPAGEQQGGAYPPEYADYGQFFARLGDSTHQSALLLTSRELPPELARLERKGAPVRRLPLSGLPLAAGQRLLAEDGLIGAVEQQQELLHRYSGNPLALQLVSRTIQDFFAGEIAAFLSDETLFFDDVREVLDQQFARLTPLERELLLWLAIEREPVPLPLLQKQLLYTGPKSAVIEALLDLQQRTLLEKTPTGFTLQNVIMEYATAYLIDAVCQEIETATPHLLHSHALLKTQTKEYIRQSQARLLLQPISERLQRKLGLAGIETKFKALLDQVRQGDAARATYIGGNLLNLLLYLGMNPSTYDFSQMAVWQADLRKADLQMLNLAQADLRNTLFAQNFIGCHTLAFSPDGELLAGGMANGEIHLWRTTNHQLDTIIKAHETIIWDLVFSPDGQWLASGSKDGSIRLWHVQTHQCQRTFTGHTDWVRAVAFHPTGQILASGGHDQTVRLWDVSSGRILHLLDNHTGWVMGLAFSPDGQRLVSASTDHTVRLWDLQTGQEELVLRGHSACTESLCFSPDGAILASASYDQTICLWDLATPVEPDSHPLLRVLRGHKGAIYSTAFSADGQRIFSAGHEEMIYGWDVESGQRLFMIPGPGREVNALAVHPAGRVLATSETGASAIHLWEIEAKPTLSHIFYGYRNWANAVAFHPHLPLVASASPAEKAHLWDALTGQHLQLFHCENGIGTSVAIGRQPNGEGAQLAFGSMDHNAWLWPLPQQTSALPTQRVAPLILPTPGEVHSLAFSPDGRQVLTSGYDGAVHLWDAQSGQPVRKFLLDGDQRLKAVAMSADGCFIAAGSHNATVALWQVATGAYQPLHGHTEWVWAVAFHPNDILASGSFDRTVRLWHVHSGEVQQVIHHEARVVQVLAFNHDGSRLAVGTGDAMIYLWDARTLTSAPTQPLPLVHKWKAHVEVIQGLAFSGEGRWLASASLDGTVKVWDVRTQECCHTLQAPGPYAGMNITGVTGISEAQKAALMVLGAREEAPVASVTASHTRLLTEQKGQETTTLQEAAPDALSTPAPHNLPQPATPFVGRADNLVELAAKLANPACRLLTLVGVGGMGKTRLALEAAAQREQVAGELFFVPLAAVSQPTALAPAIASALGITLRGHEPKALLVQALRTRRLLLILDNFEQLLPNAVAAASGLSPEAEDAQAAIGLLVELLQSAPQVQILVTSRERLNIRGEQLHLVKGMRFPQQATLAEATAATAVQLFLQSAQRVQPAFALTSANLPLVLRICQLVQGMPLALELATAWLDQLSLAEIVQAITHSADFLAADWRDLPARQRSMRAVFGWSWRLLAETEQRVLRQLALFQGGFTRQAAESVVGATLHDLSNLGHKSLLRYSPASVADQQDDERHGGRYEMHELLRQFAAEGLTADERATVAARHGRFYLTLLADQAQPLARQAPHQARQLIQQELDNVRQAWQWASDQGQSDLLAQAAYTWWQFTLLSGLEAEGEQSFRLAIATLRRQMAQTDATNLQWQRTMSLLLALHADYLFWHGDYAQMAAEAREAIDLGAVSGGVEGETMGYFSLGWAMQELGPQAEARAAWEQSIQLARRYQIHHPASELLREVEWMAHDWLRGVLFYFEEFALGRAVAVEAVHICRALGKVRGAMFALASLAGCDYYLGNYAAARQGYAEALTLIRQLDYPLGEASAQRGLGLVLRLQGDYMQAHNALVQALTISRRIGVAYYEAFSLIYLVRVHCQLGDWAGARRWLDELEALLARVPLTPTTQSHYQLARAVYYYFIGEAQTALNLAEAAWQVCEQFDIPTHRADAAVIIGHLRASLQQDSAADAYTQAVALYEKLGNGTLATEAQAGLAQLALRQGDLPTAKQLVDQILLVLNAPSGRPPCATVHTPLYTYLVCYQVLATTDPLRAAIVLQQAQTLLATYAEHIPDAELRRAFLADVAVHREITAVALPTLAALATADDSTSALASPVPTPQRAPVVLPAEVTGFVGRETEIVLVQQRLADPACRLLTITGMGGVGKSRLALRIAHLLVARLTNAQTPQFPAGIYYVPLAALEPHPQLEHLLATTVAAVLGMPLTGAAPTTQLLQALAEKDLLLILDNCEHLPVAAFINQLLQQTRAVKVLVTSRTRLNIRGEQLIRLTGLTIPTATLPTQVTPENLWQLNEHSAIRLFVQNVQAILPDFTLDSTTAAPVVQICQLLHGLPLGIELAATWAHLLPLPEIVQELRHNLDFLENAQLDLPAHQRSLRAVFNHSWQRLTAAEQQVLRRLTVFSGGFTREAAVQVAGATLPLLAQLTDKSLVSRVDPTGETMTNAAASARVRYELQSVVRQYAAEALRQAGETTTYQERHAAYMAQFLATQRAALQSAQQQEALHAIHAEIENVRTAWQWLLTHLPTAQSALAQIAEQVSQGFDSLFHFYDMHSWFQEGEAVFGQLAQQLAAVVPPLTGVTTLQQPAATLWRLQAKAQARQGWFAFYRGQPAESRRLLTVSLHCLQQLQAEADTIFNLNYLGALLRHLGEFDQATAYLQSAQRLAQQYNDPIANLRPAVASLPSAQSEVAVIPGMPLVARGQELARLETALAQMLAGHSQIYFVTGEAGSGKTALTRAFVQQAQANHPNLVVLGTLCSAQNGVGDPYLPFRLLLQQLTGATETTDVTNPLTPVATISRLLPLVTTALLERGTDLLENFVTGAALLTAAEATGSVNGDWLLRLRDYNTWAVTQTQGQERRAVAPQRLFAEYTAVLQRVTAEHPLVLLLDDLQWADASSLSLLFHLIRNLTQSRILFLGAYRPEELRQPQRDEPHPLATLVSECKRIFGDVVIDLDRTIEQTGRGFVDAFLDREPNQLGERFRQALFAHTKGHPLFTIELLRDLEAQGHLRRDASGYWVEPAAITWKTLPARVEGVIEAQMGRLPLPLHQLLQAASVEGEEFTAEVVAHVQGMNKREVVRRLEQELDRQYRLVVAQGSNPNGAVRITRYRFRHQLFQHYLYHDLRAGERRLLHSDVAAALIALYGHDHSAITVQLARHLAEAGDNERAATYAIRAGDSSARAFAFVEARLHYGQALKLLATLEESVALCRLRIDTTCKYADAAVSFAPSAAVVTQIKAAQPLLAALPVPPDEADRTRRAWLQRWLGHFARLSNETATAFAYLEPLLAEAKILNNEELGADVAGILGWIYLFLGRFAQAEPLLQQTLAFCEKEGNQREWAQSANDCGVVAVHRGHCAEGIVLVQRCLQIAQAASDAEAIATNHFYLAWVYLIVGEYEAAFTQLHQALAVEEETGQVGLADVVAMFQGWLHCRQGEVALAQTALARMQSQDNYLYSVVYPIIQLELALAAGQTDQAVALASQTLPTVIASGDRWGEGCVQRLWAQALAVSTPPPWTAVDQHFTESLRAFAEGGALLEMARTHVAWGQSLTQRAPALAAEHLAQAAAQFAAADLPHELAKVQMLLSGM